MERVPASPSCLNVVAPRHIRELPSGSFQAIVYAGKDPLPGTERYERETAKTYQAAEIALTRLQARVDEDRQPKSDLTVRQVRRRRPDCSARRGPPTRTGVCCSG